MSCLVCFNIPCLCRFPHVKSLGHLQSTIPMRYINRTKGEFLWTTLSTGSIVTNAENVPMSMTFSYVKRVPTHFARG